MTELELTPTALAVHVTGADKLWALKSRLEIPLAHIRYAAIEPKVSHGGPRGVRFPGTYLPGVVTAGTFISVGARVFWDVHNPDKAIVIALADERYTALVIEVANPEQAVATITQALQAYSAS